MSSQAWFNFWEIFTIAANVFVVVGLYKEYGTTVILSFLTFWRKPNPEFHIKVESPSERKGGAIVVFAITAEIIGATGILVQSDRLETQHRLEIADLRIVAYGRPISESLKANIIAACKGKCADRELSIGSSIGDDSSALVGFELKSALSKAHFKHLTDNVGHQIIAGLSTIGVVIIGDPNDHLVIALLHALASTKELLVVLNPKFRLDPTSANLCRCASIYAAIRGNTGILGVPPSPWLGI